MHLSVNKEGVVVLPTLSQLGNMQELNDNKIHFNDIKDIQKQLYIVTESYLDQKVFNTLDKWKEKYSEEDYGKATRSEALKMKEDLNKATQKN